MKFFLSLCLILICIVFAQNVQGAASKLKECQKTAQANCKQTPVCGRIAGSKFCRYFNLDCVRQMKNCNRIANDYHVYNPADDSLCLGLTAGKLGPCNIPAPGA